MRPQFRTLLLTILAGSASLVCGQAAPASQSKYGINVQPGPMDALLLKDYAPASSLVVPRTPVAKARYPVIDVHSHSSMNRMKTPADVAAWIRRMDQVGVEISVVFTEATGAEFDRQADLFLKAHPTRFQVYCGLDVTAIAAPDYPARAARELERCYRRGARGVGEITDKGWEQNMYEGWWRLLETADENLPGRIWWRYYGLELPDELLKRLYRDNARQLLNWTKP